MNYPLHIIIYLTILICFSVYGVSVKSEDMPQKKKDVSSASQLQECKGALDVLKVLQAFEKVRTVDYRASPLPKFLQILFTGGWIYEYPISINGSTKKITLSIRKYNETDQVSRTIVLERLTKVLSELPKSLLSKIDEVVVIDRHIGRLVTSINVTNMKVISIINITSINDESPNFFHFTILSMSGIYNKSSEYDHNYLLSEIRQILERFIVFLKYKHTNMPEAPPKWHDAILADNRNISNDNDKSIKKDFIETIELYLETDGGLKKPSMAFTYRHRFEILDEIMGVDSSFRREINRIGIILNMMSPLILGENND